MAELNRDEFLLMLNQEPSRGDIPGRASTAGFSPQDIARYPTSFTERYQRSGIPLDTSTGAPLGTRLRLSFAPDDPTRVAMLQQSYKGATIEPIEDNQFIVRNVVDPESQKTIDLLVDEQSISAKDFADLASIIPEAVGSYLAIRGGRGRTEAAFRPGVQRILAEAGLGAVGSQTAGALADATARLTTGQKVQPLEILERRERGALGEGIVGGALGIIPSMGASIARRIGRPRTIVQESGIEAVDRLAEKTGIRIRMSFGEETGSPNALRAEAIVEKSPTGGAFLKAQQRAGAEDMRAVQRFLIGESPLPVDTASERAVSVLRDVADQAKQSVDTQTQAIGSRAANDLADAITGATGFQRSVLKSEAGPAIRDALFTRKAAFDAKADELYAAIGSDPLIPVKPLQDELTKIKGQMTKARVIGESEIISGVDEFGPITAATDTEGREVLREFVPENLNRFLTGIAKLDPETPLSELRALRTQINDAKRQSEILPGVSTRFLSQFSAAIGKAIEESASNIPDPGVVARLQKANTFYREIERFSPKGVVELLADPDQVRLGPFAVANQVIRDPDQYFRIKKMLTEPLTDPDGNVVNPPDFGTWNLVKRAAITEIEDKGRLAGTGSLASGKKMLDELGKLEPEIVKDLFGQNAAQAVDSMRTMGVLEGKVDIEDFKKLLGSGHATSLQFDQLVRAQEKLDKLYKENVIKKFVAGDIDTTAIEPGEFVDRFIDVARNEDEVAKVMSRLSGDPDLLETIKSRTIQNVFQRAARAPSAEDIARGLGDDPTVTVDPSRLFKSLTGDEAKLRTVLGNDTFSLLKDYAGVAAQKSVKEEAAQTVGGLIGGSLMSHLLNLEFGKIPAHLKYAFAGTVLSRPQLISILRRGREADPTTIARAIIVSAPFIEGIMSDFGKGPGAAALRMFGEAVGLGDRTAQPTQQTPAPVSDRDAFIQSLE